jgi:hypothetical protein
MTQATIQLNTAAQAAAPTLSKRALETLIDLVEIKLSCIEVWDKEDAREQASLELARRELQALLQSGRVAKGPKIRVAQSRVPVPDTAGVAIPPRQTGPQLLQSAC